MERPTSQSVAIALLFALVTGVLLSWVPTQWFAAAMSYDRNLGSPLWIGNSFAIYAPTDWIRWGLRLHDQEATASAVRIMTLLGVTAVGVGLSSAALWLSKKPVES